ncbi:zinc finger protein 530-like [Osmerus eperlanus]|uniref:zinc finger protein 530-like n=1 Tax=Osmerus eperlanus TaxID=29151 RepID=UPI002E0D766C
MMQKTQIENDNLSTHFDSVGSDCELEDDLPFCFSCEEWFPDRMWLEEHWCPAVKYICTCGTEFSLYMDMLKHSSNHEPGHSMLDHSTIKKRRMEMMKQKERQVRWFKPVHINSPSKPLSSPIVSTVDLWPLYQPVVLLKTLRCFDKEKPFQCANCEEGFTSKNNLIRHHTVHNKRRVLACVLCGELLPISKSVPVPHICHSSSTALMARITSAPKARSTTAPVVRKTTASTALSITTALNDKVFKMDVGEEHPIGIPEGAQTYTLSKHRVCEKTMLETPGKECFRCRLCQLPFHTAHLLQRHECEKASGYVERLALMPKNRRRVKHSPSPYTQNTADRELQVNIQASRGIQRYHNKAVGPDLTLKGPAVTIKTECDSDDDCYVIESSSSKPTQLLKMTYASTLSQ